MPPLHQRNGRWICQSDAKRAKVIDVDAEADADDDAEADAEAEVTPEVEVEKGNHQVATVLVAFFASQHGASETPLRGRSVTLPRRRRRYT